MSNRDLLKRVLNGGTARHSKQRVFSVCKGEKRLIDEHDVDIEHDIEINVHCTDLQQLELQRNPYRKDT